jgi:hypothetical protein
MIQEVTRASDDVLFVIFKAANFLRRETISLIKFPNPYALISFCKSSITERLYHDEKSCVEMIFCIYNIVH